MSQARSPQMSFGRRGPGMGAPVEKPKNGKETLRRLLSYFKPQRGLVLLLFLFPAFLQDKMNVRMPGICLFVRIKLKTRSGPGRAKTGSPAHS